MTEEEEDRGGIGHSKYRSWVVRNTVRSFGEIHLTKFEKYSKNRSDPDFCDRQTEEDRGIGHSSSLIMVNYKVLLLQIFDIFPIFVAVYCTNIFFIVILLISEAFTLGRNMKEKSLFKVYAML